MISFNNKDDNMPEIKELSGIADTVTKYNFRVYGLKDKPKRQVIRLGIPYDLFPDLIADRRNQCIRFLRKHGLTVRSDLSYDYRPVFTVGLTRSLRKDLKLSAFIVRFIVYSMEGRISISDFEKTLADVKKRVKSIEKCNKIEPSIHIKVKRSQRTEKQYIAW